MNQTQPHMEALSVTGNVWAAEDMRGPEKAVSYDMGLGSSQCSYRRMLGTVAQVSRKAESRLTQRE